MTDGTPGWIKLVNAREDMEYRLVYKGGGDTNMVPHFASIGYEVVEATETGVKLQAARGIVLGQPIEFRGHVLMCVSKERAEEVRQFGEDGNTGQELCDRIESIIRRENARDRIIGRGGRIRSVGDSDDQDFVDDN